MITQKINRPNDNSRIIGRKFGYLVVIRMHSKTRINQRSGFLIKWLCKCDCGNETIKAYSGLYSRTVSCGCKTPKQNFYHQSLIRDKTHSEGKFRGVWTYTGKKGIGYYARMRIDGKKIMEGPFENATEAAMFYDKKQIERFGTDAITNFPIETYDD